MRRNPHWTFLGPFLALALAACGGGEPAPDASPSPEASVAVATPAPSPSASPAPAPAEYVAGGNEPFWSVETKPGAVTYSTPEQLDGVTLTATRSQAGGWTRFAARFENAPLVLEVRKAPCTDSMSGFAFSHEARITRADGTWDGCARLTSEPQPRE